MTTTVDLYVDPTVSDDDDNGTMPESIAALAEEVIGHKIVSVEKDVEFPGERSGWGANVGTKITLDNGKAVFMFEEGDCCAYTALEEFLLHPEAVDHIITGVKTEEGYTKWHIYADFGDVLELSVGWSCGNPFYYGYGFDIEVVDV